MCHILASKPLEIVAMDFTLLEKSTSGLEDVLVVTDVFFQSLSWQFQSGIRKQRLL